MKSIAVASRKGGAGKTTLAAHLAVAASAKQRVVLMDMDSQQSLTDWWHLRQDETPELMNGSVQTLQRELANVKGEDGLLVIDTPPVDSETIATVIKSVDLVVIPVKPSALDVRAVAVTRELAEKAGKPFLFVITQAIPRAGMTAEAMDVLRSYGPVSPTVMHSRVDYAAALTDGRTAMELDGTSKASIELASIWNAVNKQLMRAVRSSK